MSKQATDDLVAKAEYEATHASASAPSDVDAAIEKAVGVPVEEASAEQIQSAWDEVYGADTFLTPDQFKVTNEKIVNALAPKPTWMTKEDQSLSYQDRAIIYQYQNVLGREVDAEGLANYRMADLDANGIAASLAASNEAYEAGVDPEKYGVTKVDPSSLGAADKAYYDVWSKYNDRPLTSADVQQFSYERDAGTIQAYEAKQAGAITARGHYDPASGGVYSITTVTPEAVEMMGGQIQLRGNQAGRYVVAPTGVEWAWGHENWKQVQDPDESGYAMYGSVGNPTGSGFSFVGDVFGDEAEAALDKFVPNEVKFAMDPLGLYTSAAYGQNWGKDAARSTAKQLGLKTEDLQTAQGIAKSVVETIAMMTPFAVPVVGAMEFSSAVNQAAQGNVKFGKAVGTAAINTTMSALGKYANPAITIGASAGAASLQGGDSEAVMDALIWSTAGAVVPGGLSTLVRPLVDKNFTWEQALMNYGVNVAGMAAAGVSPLDELRTPVQSAGRRVSRFYKAPVLDVDAIKSDWYDIANTYPGVDVPGKTPASLQSRKMYA